MTIELKGYNPEHLDELAQLVAVAGNNTTGLDASRKGLEARLRYPRLIPERDLITAWDVSTNRMIGYALVFAGADIKASTVALGIAPHPPARSLSEVEVPVSFSQHPPSPPSKSKCPCPSKALLDRCSQIATEQDAEVIRSAVFDDDEGSERARRALEVAGYKAVRDYQRMVTEVNPQGLTHPELTIRKLDSSEAGLLMELQNASFAEHYNHSLNTLEEIQFMLDVENADKEVLVAEVDGRPVGYVWFTPKPDADNLGGIKMIGILKDWRGKGFAKILLDSAIASLSRLGATKGLVRGRHKQRGRCPRLRVNRLHTLQRNHLVPKVRSLSHLIGGWCGGPRPSAWSAVYKRGVGLGLTNVTNIVYK